MAVSIKDVGRLAGVSVSTVSRAFNGYSDINPVTKQRILEAAEALGYSPNISARNLSSKKKQNIGLVISGFLQENTAQARNDEFEFWLMHGAYRCARDLDLDVAMYSIDSEFQKRKTYEQFCAERNLSGTLMFGLKITDEYFHQLHDAEIPCVTVDTLVRGRNVGCVTIDNVLAFQELTQYLFDLGHRELLLVTGRKTAAVTMERMAGAYEAYLANNFEFRKENVVYCDFREDEAYRKTKLYLQKRRKNGATAFLCMSDMMAVGVLRAVKECGYRVPEDFSVVGFDGILLTTYTEPKLTTVDQQIEQKGYEGMRLLSRMLERPEEARCLYLPHVLKERQSTGQKNEEGS